MTTASPRGTRRTPAARRGASLPLVLLVLVLGLVGLVGGFNRLSSERRITGEARSTIDAQMLAQTGLEQYLMRPPALGGRAAHDTTITDIAGGTVNVSARLIYTGSPTLWYVTARSSVTPDDRYDTQSPAASDIAGQIAAFTPGTGGAMACPAAAAAWLHLGFVRINNGADGSLISGEDPGFPVTALATVADNESSNELRNRGRYPEHGNLRGSSGDQALIHATAGAAEATLPAIVRLNWSTIRTGNYWVPHGRVDQNGNRTGQFAPYRVVMTNPGGDTNINSNEVLAGSGVLIVPGNLNVGGTLAWEGLVLVGGRVQVNGSGGAHQIPLFVNGAMFSGLNTLLTPSTTDKAETSVLNQAILVEYSAGAVQEALRQTGGFVATNGTFTRLVNARSSLAP